MAVTRCSAIEAAEYGIRVNAVAPSIAIHPFLVKTTPQELLDELEAKGSSVAAAPWEVSNVMVFLRAITPRTTGEVVLGLEPARLTSTGGLDRLRVRSSGAGREGEDAGLRSGRSSLAVSGRSCRIDARETPRSSRRWAFNWTFAREPDERDPGMRVACRSFRLPSATPVVRAAIGGSEEPEMSIVDDVTAQVKTA